MKDNVPIQDVKLIGVTKGIRRLRQPDNTTVLVPPADQPSLVVTRWGEMEALPISRRVAEELISLGFIYGS